MIHRRAGSPTGRAPLISATVYILHRNPRENRPTLVQISVYCMVCMAYGYSTTSRKPPLLAFSPSSRATRAPSKSTTSVLYEHVQYSVRDPPGLNRRNCSIHLRLESSRRCPTAWETLSLSVLQLQIMLLFYRV